MNLTKTDRLMVTLGRQIVSGKYLPGAALPAEADLNRMKTRGSSRR